MKIIILEEAGYVSALYGLGLSYGLTSDISFEDFNKLSNRELFDRIKKIGYSLTPRDKGHNKFLESIEMWLLVQAPRYWWSEADTYRISSKQSESTMHTLLKEPITSDMFIKDVNPMYIDYLEQIRKSEIGMKEKLFLMKRNLPEGFLQKREWKVSYKTLRNILVQRKNHQLEEWRCFCDFIMTYSKHKELFDDLKY